MQGTFRPRVDSGSWGFVKVAIDGVAVLGRLRPLLPEDRERLDAAARIVIAGGYAGQARKLLEDSALLALVPDLATPLRQLAREG